MSDQYAVLGKAPGIDELKNLSPENTHLSISKLSAGYGKMEILHDFNSVSYTHLRAHET